MSFKAFKARKLEALTENETIASVNSWQQNLEFQLAACNEFSPFLASDFTWSRKSVTDRGLTDDTTGDVNSRKTAAQKCIVLNHMLGLIISYCPENIRLEIERKSTSLKWIWQRVRRHYGFSKSEVHFLKLANIKLNEGERYESFFQRLMSHLCDNLLTTDSGIVFDGQKVTENEEMSPTVERLAVYLWLKLIDERLPLYVARVYSHDLQTKSIRDLQPEICDNLESLLLEISAQEDIKLAYSSSNHNKRSFPRKDFQKPRSSKTCAFCKAAGKPFNGHDISNCWSLSKFDRSKLIKALQVQVEDEDSCLSDVNNLSIEDQETALDENPATCSRVLSMQSPYFYCYYKSSPCKVIIDSGATSSVVTLAFVRMNNIKMVNATQNARQLDKTLIKTVGEINVNLSFGNKVLKLSALVTETMDSDIIAGVPFCRCNNIEISFAKQQIFVDGKTVDYGAQPSRAKQGNVSSILRTSTHTVVYPGEFIEIKDPKLAVFDDEIAIEPRFDSPQNGNWPAPGVSRVVDGSVRIPNNSDSPIYLAKNQHFGQINRVISVEQCLTINLNKCDNVHTNSKNLKPAIPFSDAVVIDPGDQLTSLEKAKFQAINKKFDSVFNPSYSGYNDKSGVIRAHITIGSIPPPPQKARLPFYSQNNLQLLQQKADDLEDKGVLVTPESVGLVPQHVSPSFLVKKPNGEWRFVTAFNDLGKFCRLPPSKVTKCSDILRRIGSYKFIIKTDLTSSFFQLKVDKESMPYLGTVTPFKGIRLYARAAMGMPGSSEWLDEVMSRVVGDLVMAGHVLLIADDLYAGANSIDTLLQIWDQLLSALSQNGLVLSAVKTVIVPKSTTILGWIWDKGTLSVSPHKVNPLQLADPPKTCTAMRSFLGAYKDISRAVPKSASLLSPLESSIAGLTGKDPIVWTEELHAHFKKAKSVLSSPKSLVIPSHDDRLVITVDASPLNNGLGATLFVMRDAERFTADLFSFKMKPHHVSWLPCEKEALAITAAANHFAPYVRDSKFSTQILTDNKPCVEAWEKLRNGKFSASARVSTFLSTLSSLNVTLCHIKGTSNNISDYNSRHPSTCENSSCQICKFVYETMDSVVRTVEAKDVLNGNVRMPFANFTAWRSAQQSDPIMRKAFAHLTAGTRPSKKTQNSKDLKNILRVASIDESKGILIVRKQDPFTGSRDLIFCPSELVHGLILAIHNYFKHPSRSQTEKLFSRQFFALSLSPAIDSICNNCEVCNSLKKIPRELFEQSSSAPPTRPGEKLAADIICRKKQKILVVRDYLTSFTSATFLSNESAEECKNGLILCCLPLKFDQSIVRVDCAPSLQKLKREDSLKHCNIILEIGKAKNINKNPVAERANQELEAELLKVDPTGNPVSAVTLLQAVCALNSRIRSNGLSSKEMITRRDQISGKHLNFKDQLLSDKQHETKAKNHSSSAKSKARGAPLAPPATASPGSLVYLKDEGNKFQPRDPYLVIKKEGSDLIVQKMPVSGFLSSKQHSVPCNKVFPIKKQQNEKLIAASDQSYCSKNDSPLLNGHETDSDSSDSDDSVAYDLPEQRNVHQQDTVPLLSDSTAGSSSRPVRNRRPPQYYGSSRHSDCIESSDQSDEMVESWYPGWDKNRTRNYINNGQQEL